MLAAREQSRLRMDRECPPYGSNKPQRAPNLLLYVGCSRSYAAPTILNVCRLLLKHNEPQLYSSYAMKSRLRLVTVCPHHSRNNTSSPEHSYRMLAAHEHHRAPTILIVCWLLLRLIEPQQYSSHVGSSWNPSCTNHT